MMKKVLLAVCVLGLVCAAVMAKIAWDIHRFTRGNWQERMEKELLPQDGTPTPQDELLLALTKDDQALPEADSLWGIGQGPDSKPTPSREAAEKALTLRAELRARLVQELPAELEPAGHAAVLQVTHWFRDHRTLTNHLAEDFLSLLVVGRTEEATALWSAGHRMARLVGRGIQGRPSLIAKMIEIAEEGVFDNALALALQRHLVPANSLDDLEAAVDGALARDLDLDPSMQSELALVEKAVALVDERLSLLRYPLRLYWGHGPSQVAKLRAAWKQREPVPVKLLKRSHIMVQIGTPNWTAAERRYRTRLALRHGLEVALALERARYAQGHYPTSAPDDVRDPSSGEPFRLVGEDGRWRLYAPGPDGEDQGGDPDQDVVVWH